MRLRVLTTVCVGTLTAVDRVAHSQEVLVQRSAYALLSANPIVACPSSKARHRKNPIGAGSSQGHSSEAERGWLQGVALEFFSQVPGREKLLNWPVLDFVWLVSPLSRLFIAA